MAINLYSTNPDEINKTKADIFAQDSDFFQRLYQSIRRCIDLYNGQPVSQLFSGSTFLINGRMVTSYPVMDAPNAPYYNEIRPLIRTLLSFATKNEPAMSCWSLNPASSKLTDVAKVAEDVNKAKYEIDSEQLYLFEAGEIDLVCGTAFRKDYWDFSLGGFIPDEQGRLVRSGDNAIEIYTPLQVGYDFSCKNFDKSKYVYERFVKSVEFGQINYGMQRVDRSFGGNIEAAKAAGYYPDVTDGIVTNKNRTIPDYLMYCEQLRRGVPYTTSSLDITDGNCEYTIFYVRPSAEFPQGRKIVWMDEKLVYATPENGENPEYLGGTPCEFHPFTMCINEEYIGRSLGKSAVELLMPIQIDSIELRALIKENEQTIAKPQLLVAENQLASEIINSKGVNAVTYKVIPGANVPTVFMGNSLPAPVYARLQNIPNEMMRILGTNGILGGDAPSGVTAASALDMLRENAGVQVAPMAKRLAFFLKRALTKKLRVIHKYHNANDPFLTKKIAEMARKRYKTQVTTFIGEKDLSDEINVEIEASSMIPKSEQQKTKSYLDLLDKGFFAQQLQADPMDAILFQNELQKKLGLDPIETDTVASFKKADWIVDQLMNGIYIEPDTMVDDSNVIVHVLKKTMLDPNYLENVEPKIKSLFAQCYTAHSDILAQQAQGQKEQMMQDQQAMMQQKVQADVATSAGKDQAKVASQMMKEAAQPKVLH